MLVAGGGIHDPPDALRKGLACGLFQIRGYSTGANLLSNSHTITSSHKIKVSGQNLGNHDISDREIGSHISRQRFAMDLLTCPGI